MKPIEYVMTEAGEELGFPSMELKTRMVAVYTSVG